MDPQVLLVASSFEGNITVWDAATGGALTSFKTNASPRNGLVPLGRDHLVAAQLKKGALHFWAWHKDQVHLRSFAPEPLCALAATPDGAYVAGGGRSGAVHLWESSSGRLLRSWPAHYKAVSCLAFSDGGAALVTAGEDCQVSAWLLVDVLDSAAGADLALQQALPGGGLRPLHTWSEHTLPVTSLGVGAGGLSAVVATASLDHSVRLRSLGSGAALRTLTLPEPLHSVALEPGEYSIYAGGASGRIYEVSLVGDDEGGPAGAEAAGPGGEAGAGGGGASTAPAAGAVAVPGTEPTRWAALEGHTLPVTALAFSADGLTLVSGSEDCSVRSWDVRSLQPLRVLASPAKGPVTALLLLPRPEHMQVGGGAQAPGAAGGSRKGPARAEPLAPFCKYATAPGALRAWEGAAVLLDGSLEAEGAAGGAASSDDEAGWAGGGLPAAPHSDGGGGQEGGEAGALRSENERLRGELTAAVAAAQQGLELNSRLQALVGSGRRAP